MKLDAAIASSPAGSIASRLPVMVASKDISQDRDTAANMAADWRYSTVPQGLAEVDLDVREPFPTESPGLPEHNIIAGGHRHIGVQEPISSGFTSPVVVKKSDLAMENDASLPPILKSSSSRSERLTTSDLPSFREGPVPECNIASTELEKPMTKLNVSHVDDWLKGVVQDSPRTKQEQRRAESAKPCDFVDTNMDDRDGPTEIILSTPAKAAAESAKLKRDMLGGGIRTNSNEENVRPVSRGSHYALRCTTPTANLLSVPIVQITPSPDFPHGSPPPSPLPLEQLPPAPPFRRVDSTGSPFPILKGKPPPVGATVGSQQQWPGYYTSTPPQQFASPPQQPPISPPFHQPYQMNYGPPPQQYPMNYPFTQQYHMGSPPPQHYPYNESSLIHNRSPPPIPNSQQIIYLHNPPPISASRGTARLLTSDRPLYSFSTAAAAHSGSSAAPDSRIRDAYRTDTLTPFEIPTSRFRKIGLGATAQSRGARKYYAAGEASAAAPPPLSRAGTTPAPRRPSSRPHEPRMGLSRAATGGGSRKYYGGGPEGVTFRSSPPRPAGGGGFQSAAPRRKKMRRSLSGDAVMEGLERTMEEDGTDGNAARAGGIGEPEMMLLNRKNELCHDDDNDTDNSVMWTPKQKRKSGSALQERDQDGVEEDEGEALRELSPYVTPYRKGKGPKPKIRDAERRPSYWDGDVLPEMVGGGKKGLKGRAEMGDLDMDREGDKENVPPLPMTTAGDEMEVEGEGEGVEGVIGAAL